MGDPDENVSRPERSKMAEGLGAVDIFVTTWNMADARAITDGDLSQWLPVGGGGAEKPACEASEEQACTRLGNFHITTTYNHITTILQPILQLHITTRFTA